MNALKTQSPQETQSADMQSLLNAVEKNMLSNTLSATQVARRMHQSMRAIGPVQLAQMPAIHVDMTLCHFHQTPDHEGVPASGYKVSEKNEQKTLPAVVSNELRAAGVQSVEWTDVMSLPGTMHQGIRELFFSIFSYFGMKPDGKLKVVASLENNALLNSPLEVNNVLGFLERYATKCSDENMIMSFEGVIDDYTPAVRLYYTETHTYLAVLEENALCGRYVYAFERDEKRIQPTK